LRTASLATLVSALAQMSQERATQSRRSSLVCQGA
jgi:hypothetical protein